ncbi:carotenoid oxygenase family protein [Mycobacterium sp. NAZ190054]|uniref:carotenoid oxygenase family protein n=1 Tax=Mycobacterium sp. NAZ190054 TaxID=1747766 RepID=UPI000A98E36C|nr:carotenoid oxygenase family protein [Mycobacterium sp. NAZ190054]
MTSNQMEHPAVDFDPTAEHMLNGIFAPITDEIDAPRLQVIQGEVPPELSGAYLRNGPNPRFTPIGSYTFPLDGDAMVHGLWFNDGEVRYANRFVRTPVMAAEERAGRALWGGLHSTVRPGADEVGDLTDQSDRDAPFVNVIGHGGRILALAESMPTYELTCDLDTVGHYTYGGVLPGGITAHPRIDPITGELVVFRYGIDRPYLTWSVVAADGRARAEQVVELDAPHMIHDCVITERYLVIFICPVVIDLEGPQRGEPALQWRTERGTRIAVIARDGSGTKWFECDAFWVWHFANAFEEAGDDGATTISIDYPYWTHPGMGIPGGPGGAGMARVRLNMTTGAAVFEQVDDRMAEFPRIDDRLIGQRHRYYHVVGKHAPVLGEWDQVRRYDTVTGEVAVRDLDHLRVGEPIFAPGAGQSGEDGGYLLFYSYDPSTLDTNLTILHAADIAGEPAATIRMPHRVPFGLHGNWIPTT